MPLYERANGIELPKKDSAALIATIPSNAAIQGENLPVRWDNDGIFIFPEVQF